MQKYTLRMCFCMFFLNNPRCNEETRTIKAVPILVWNFDPISWKIIKFDQIFVKQKIRV